MTEVTDADRQAAVELATIMMGNCHSFTAELKTAERHFMLTAFARHREAAEAPLRAEIERLKGALWLFVMLERSIKIDVGSCHKMRGNGASAEMREDDRDMRTDIEAAFDAARAALEPKP